jgi:hypothetical protein
MRATKRGEKTLGRQQIPCRLIVVTTHRERARALEARQ